MSAIVDLGTFCIESKQSDLELSLRSSVRCTASGKDEIDELQTRLNSSQLNTNSTPRPWLYCGSSLSLMISLSIEAEINADEHELVTDTFSMQLRAAMIWQHLHFSQPSVQTLSTQYGKTIFELTLARAIDSTQQPPSSPHKLSIDVPYCDVSPPPGVIKASVEIVNLDIQIRMAPERRTSGKQLPKAEDMLFAPSTREAVSNHPVNSSILSQSRRNISARFQALADQHDLADENLFTWASDDDGCDDNDYEMLLEAEHIDDCEATSRAEEVLTFLDVALRCAISTRPGRLPKGVSIKGDKSFQRLSSIAPALFRPNHLPAIASRAVFLPAISRALASICLDKAKSIPLVMTCTGLVSHQFKAEPSNMQHDTAKENSRTSTHTRTEQLSQILWSTLERSLLVSTPEKRLESIAMSLHNFHGLEIDDAIFGITESMNLTPSISSEMNSEHLLGAQAFDEEVLELNDLSDGISDDLRFGTDFASCSGGNIIPSTSSDFGADMPRNGCDQADNIRLHEDAHEDEHDLPILDEIGISTLDAPFATLNEHAMSVCGNSSGMALLDEALSPCLVALRRSGVANSDDMLHI